MIDPRRHSINWESVHDQELQVVVVVVMGLIAMSAAFHFFAF